MIEPKPGTTAEMKLLKAGTPIADKRPSDAELAFTHTVLCCVGVPRAKLTHPSKRKSRRGRPTKVGQLARRVGAAHIAPPTMGA